jgi:hypothetical protein
MRLVAVSRAKHKIGNNRQIEQEINDDKAATIMPELPEEGRGQQP